ncbi:molybdate ABC transporter substrate-binding protein [Leucobacter triazinivorans]|uniref:Molybdate ABC transporter substrate-binding protein n=1 Tax=Leucobacter triazinivorans TaxID=1784719 RepID=A0A4P6KDF1_9MICO|nr:molybdate ABC transporter substrate-binding protein [Leucobacter triazinivorans]QBE47941.1 molybdate ABC transporter substrate-binding protein [Leucobacter triazinivorans]
MPAVRRAHTRARTRIAAAAAVGAAALLLLGCSAPSTSAPSTSAPAEGTAAAGGEFEGELTVFAAASLQPAFEQLAERFTAQHPRVTLTQTFDGSSVLATQIQSGAGADVFASADEANMQKVVDAGLIESEPATFATSELVIAVAPDNPLGIETLADLARPATGGALPVVVVCAAEVPCGTASRTLLERDGVALDPASEEQNVTAVLTKVRGGEADAGLVYHSDVLRSGDEVVGVPIPGAEDAAGAYMIAPVVGSASPEAAAAFVDFMGSEEAQRVLADLGFRPA